MGGWLFLSPWIFGFRGDADVAWSVWIIGGGVLVLAVWALSDRGLLQDGATPAALIGFFSPGFVKYAFLASTAWKVWILTVASFGVALWAAQTPP